VFVLCYVCRGVWNELITRLEASYWVCLSNCVV
jgi:hypothetical protein